MPKDTKQGKKQLVDSRVKRAEQGKLIYKIDCSIPCKDEVVTGEIMTRFADYLNTHVKVNGKTGQLGHKCIIKAEDSQIVITKHKVLFAKRYLKFLTRKFLKREKLRDYLRPVASKKHEYQLRYYNIHLDDDEE